MKFNWTSKEIMNNRGCYSEEQVKSLSFINKDTITLIDILESEISIRDKRWFFYKKADLNLKQQTDLAFLMAKCVSEIYNKRYPDDNRVKECIQAIEDFNAGKINRDELMIKRSYAAAYAAAAAAYAAAAAAYAAAAAAYAAAYAAAAAAYAAAAAAADDYYTMQLQKIMLTFITQENNVS